MKQRVGIALLPAALTGLSRITHLMNIDTVQDLMAVLRSLLDQQPPLPLHVQIRCIHCALHTLSGPGKELQLDGDVYLRRLRFLLGELPPAFADWSSVVDLMDLCFLRYREERQNIVSAFCRLLLLLAAQFADSQGATLCTMVNAILQRYPRLRRDLFVLQPAAALMPTKSTAVASASSSAKLFVEDDTVEDLAMKALREADPAATKLGLDGSGGSSGGSSSGEQPLWRRWCPAQLLGVDSVLWYRVARRSAILFLIGMFLANGYEYQTWRVPGVLQYFAVSYCVTGCTILGTHSLTRPALRRLKAQQADSAASQGEAAAADGSALRRWLRRCGLAVGPSVLSAYRYEWAVQLLILAVYLSVSYGARAPGCPRGYLGPGGMAEHGAHEFCTGGIHRYIDMQVFGYDFIYHSPTCKQLYGCRAYDPEGLLGSLSACSLTYLGLMAGRVVVHFKEHRERLARWLLWGASLLLLTGVLCGFSREDGAIPINKNLWSTSFVSAAAGGGLVLLSVFYQLIDVWKVWSGAPFFYLGMNSILIYVGHDVLGGFMPFSYQVYDVNHGSLLQMNLLGTLSWVVVAAYLHRIKFFVKI